MRCCFATFIVDEIVHFTRREVRLARTSASSSCPRVSPNSPRVDCPLAEIPDKSATASVVSGSLTLIAGAPPSIDDGSKCAPHTPSPSGSTRLCKALAMRVGNFAVDALDQKYLHLGRLMGCSASISAFKVACFTGWPLPTSRPPKKLCSPFCQVPARYHQSSAAPGPRSSRQPPGGEDRNGEVWAATVPLN